MADSTHFDILAAVVEAVRGLHLEGVPDEQVVLLKAAYGADLQKPAFVVSPGDEGEDLYGGATSFRSRHQGFPCLLTYVPAAPQERGLTPLELSWRAAVINHFVGTEAAAAATVEAAGRDWRAEVVPRAVIDSNLWARTGWFVGSVLLRFYAMV